MYVSCFKILASLKFYIVITQSIWHVSFFSRYRDVYFPPNALPPQSLRENNMHSSEFIGYDIGAPQGNAKAIFTYICNMIGNDLFNKHPLPSNEKLTTILNISPRSIGRGLKELQERDFIIIKREKISHQSSEYLRSVAFKL